MTIRMFHIPVCPFSQRLEILLNLKNLNHLVEFVRVDITKPRDPHILALSGGTTALPVLELEDGRALKESLVLMDYFDTRFPEHPIRRTDAWERAVENLMVTMEGAFTMSGYNLVMNQDPERRQALIDKYLEQHQKVNDFLLRYGSTTGPWLFESFGWAEAVFTPFFRRFAFVPYYEGIDIPDNDAFARVRAWREACLQHPAAQQVSDEEVVKVYYDYARGAGNGRTLPGRQHSSFVFSPPWQQRPWPPKDKYGPLATDEELGLVSA
jgi:glutathione S-transferase